MQYCTNGNTGLRQPTNKYRSGFTPLAGNPMTISRVAVDTNRRTGRSRKTLSLFRECHRVAISSPPLLTCCKASLATVSAGLMRKASVHAPIASAV